MPKLLWFFDCQNYGLLCQKWPTTEFGTVKTLGSLSLLFPVAGVYSV